jgi:thiol-disulfide isomerase/thioredoxin
MHRVIIFLISGLSLVGPCLAQEQTLLPRPAEEILVRFGDERTILDDSGVHIESVRRHPTEILFHPDIDTTGARYLSLYYSRDVVRHEGDFLITILAVPHPGGQLLFADLNNDEDLRNDGPPQFLADSAGTVTFALVAPNDSMQITHRSVERVPAAVRAGQMDREWFEGMMDEDGNLRPMLANLFEVNPERGSFVFDDRPVLVRGKLGIGMDTLDIGVYDWSANGRYDDEDDVLLVDLDRDGRLIFSGDSAHVFKLREVFEIEGRRYRVSQIDPYGRGIRLVEVPELPTGDYLAERRAEFDAAMIVPRASIALDSAFWALELPTLEGDTLRLAELRGRPFLLNVWGEWCAPCRMEMPTLARADSLFSIEELQLIGVLSTGDIESARAYLDEIGATWSQLLLTDAFRERMNLRMYPTNYLIGSAGERAVEAGLINIRFIEAWLEAE